MSDYDWIETQLREHPSYLCVTADEYATIRNVAQLMPNPSATATLLGVAVYVVKPECKSHPIGRHDEPVNPDGCGHCSACHSDEGCPGHWIGCPGC